MTESSSPSSPFRAFLADLKPHEGRRAEIDRAYREPEPDTIRRLLEAAELPAATLNEARALSRP